ncbi:acyl-CoA synthetase [Sphaerisporangium siamense]|uniref:Acyl-CoA synthetase (AMP-forming)/AMP-acid ligase II n=1 Tax=Sphaerisporangium siamense TaxID=795645 RepID=A0A7W7DFE3_9ACTN|nr:acyl-CoA synthetase [Sphaerisporangium siamense]MBB4705793.1 acyl-CoA synthetase (AMP-forming)/AMP-acid ligase II [Sphaerisporangium siamense]GII82820.1 acyl-CoA synthetase [Sphaerisporangium siamense]
MEFNHADLFEGLADAIGDRVAVVCGERRLTFAELDAHANRLAHYLAGRGVRPGAHVGVQLYNGVEHIAALLAVLKIRAVPVNVNYRYVERELVYLYTDSDIVALLYDVEFDDRVAAAAPRCPKLATLIAVGGPTRVAGAVPYERALAGRPEGRDGFPRRSGDDLYIIYTGGTTGMPKGVMWRTRDLFAAFGGGNPFGPPLTEPRQVIESASGPRRVVMMPAAPLAHGAAQMATFISWWMGGTVVYTRRFDAVEVLRAIEREKVFGVTITGDAMARPLADAIADGAYDLSSLMAISSTGAILSGAVRERLGELLPHVLIRDGFGSTESGFTAAAVPGSSPESGLRYRPLGTATLAVLDDALRPVRPGSGEIGTLATAGNIAVGYYNDPEKTARAFVTDAAGTRWLLTGDLATVEEDGAVLVFGRGSQCINSGGAKVFAEEVEAVLKGHPEVFDAVVTGVPDERWGSRVAAVVEPRRGAAPTAGELDAYCRGRLSGYKVPRSYAFVENVVRSPSGKADYRWAGAVATSA